MRILDRVVQGAVGNGRIDNRGRIWPMRGAGAFARDICECPVRYILDRSASTQCAEFMRSGQFPSAEDPVVRIPFQRFWMEYHSEEADSLRYGVLGDVSASGRSGSLRCFCESDDGNVHSAGASIDFDFDRPVRPLTGVGRLRHADLTEVDELFRHVRLVPDEDWLSWARACDASINKPLADLGELCWTVLPVTIAFALLMSARGALGSRNSQLDRLNRARVKRGKIPLLDHVEISFLLGKKSFSDTHSRGSEANRRAPRLHFVRGHQVHRAGAMFWRTSHFRGDNGPIPITTARVSARANV